MRLSYSGIIIDFQSIDVGSIPANRSTFFNFFTKTILSYETGTSC
jgi:hypothetical protein